MARLYIWSTDDLLFKSLENMRFLLNTYVPFSERFKDLDILAEISYNILLVLDDLDAFREYYSWIKDFIPKNANTGADIKLFMPISLKETIERSPMEDVQNYISDITFFGEGTGNVYISSNEALYSLLERSYNIVLINTDLKFQDAKKILENVNAKDIGIKITFIEELANNDKVIFNDRGNITSIKAEKYKEIAQERVALLDSLKREKSLLASIYPILVSYIDSDADYKKYVLIQISLIELFLTFDF